MATSSLQRAKRRSFNLPSFRRLSAGERQEAARNADEMARRGEQEEAAARVQKAAAWQWYTRGVGETVQVPTTRPPVGNSQAPARDDKTGVMQKRTVEPPLAESPRAASRFKAEASSASFNGAPRPTLWAPSGGPSTPLYDQFELSSLRTHMADYVQRLQHQPTKDNEQSPAVAEHRSMLRPSAPSVSSDHQRSKASPAGNSSNDHQRLTTLPSSAVPVASASATTPLHIRPFSTLRRLFRKVVFGWGTFTKSRKNSPQTIYSSPRPMSHIHEPGLLPEEEEDNMVLAENTLYHYHHYIHHHHHHYHYAESPEERADLLIRSRRRHSESSSGRPPIPTLWEEKSGEEEDEAEKSPMEAYLARRRRHSDSFSECLQPKKVGFDEDEGIKTDPGSGRQSSRPERRQYNSERFSPNKISTMVSEKIAQSVVGRGEELSAGIAGMKSTRRHSAELCWEEASNLQRTGGKIGEGTYKLGGGGAASGGTPAILPAVRARRHSESSKLRSVGTQQHEMEKHTPSLGRSFWQSPSARYYLNMQEHHIGVPVAATGELHAALPALYP